MLAVAVKTLILSLALSLLVAAAFVIHFATGWTTFEREELGFGAAFLSALLVLVWSASVPLDLAVILLHRRSRLAAYLCAVTLVPLSITDFISRRPVAIGDCRHCGCSPCPAGVARLAGGQVVAEPALTHHTGLATRLCPSGPFQ